MEQLHVEQAIRRVVGAISRTSKAALAQRSGVAESNLRDCENPDWRPNTKTLEKLERAAIEIEREFSDSPSPPPTPEQDVAA